MLVVPVLLAVFPPRYTTSDRVWWTIALYALAKILELLDREIGSMVATGGHPWKHLAAAAALLVYVRAVARRRPLEATPVTPGWPVLVRQGASQ
jgi:hypothetical protein